MRPGFTHASRHPHRHHSIKILLSSLRHLTFAGFAGFATCALAPLGAAHARAHANLTFGGGNGTSLFLTLSAPVNYAITTAAGNDNAPFFDFQRVSNAFNSNYSTLSGTLTFTINHGAAQMFTHLYSGYTSGSIAAADAYILSSRPGLAVSDTVVLQAGTPTTSDNFAGPLPASGSFPTFIFDANGNKLDAVNGVSAVPKPST